MDDRPGYDSRSNPAPRLPESLIACALVPRFSLLAALGGRREAMGEPVALAPEPGGPQAIGEASGAAEAFGVRAGMSLSEALARCPALGLVPPDPDLAETRWEAAIRRLEEIGAAVEPSRAGEAFFSAEALLGLYGDAQRALRRAARALGPGARLGAGPSRLCAYAAARRARPRRPPVVIEPRAAARFAAELPVDVLRRRLPDRWERANLPLTLERLGVTTLGELASLPAAAVADRFGEPGLRAQSLARGEEAPLRPRRPREQIAERLELPEAAAGPGLEQAIGLLVDRLLARPARGGRSLRRMRLEARLAGGGGWRVEVVLRSASADPMRLRLALTSRLAQVPGPVTAIAVRALELGSPPGDQRSLTRSDAERRRLALTEAVRQVRAAAGRDSLLQVLDVEPESRVPERRAMLTPFPERPDG